MSLTQRLVMASTLGASYQPREITLGLGSWRPDVETFPSPGLMTASGVYRLSPTAYAPMPNHNVISDALSAYARGAIALRDTSAAVYMYAGDATKLYAMSAATWTDVSDAGGYSTAAGEVWEFTRFRNTVVATNYANEVQGVTVGSSPFANLITSTLKPNARHCATINNFLVLGNTIDGTDGTIPNRVWWSAIGDATDFDPDSATQCDFNNIADAGAVQKIVGGRQYGLVFCEDRVYRMNYAGPNTIFDFYPMDYTRGTPIPNSVIGHGQAAFWITDEGFFATDGESSTPIGQHKVDRTFWNQIDKSNFDRVSAAIDAQRNLACWLFPGTNSSGGTPNKMYLFHWPTGDFSEVEFDGDLIFSAVDTTDNIEVLGAFNTDNRFGRFNSTLKPAATLEMGDHKFNEAGRSHIHRTRPHVMGEFAVGGSTNLETEAGADLEIELTGGGALQTEEATVSVAIAGRKRLSLAVDYDANASMSAIGECVAHNDDEYQRIKISMASGVNWESISGITVETTPSGKL